MVKLVDLDDIMELFPRSLEEGERNRATALIVAADDRIREEFERQGRDLDSVAASHPWLGRAYHRVVREMVAAAILIGDNVGRASASSTTGPQSDSVTWSQGVPIAWGFIEMTDKMRADLGLFRQDLPVGSFPPPLRWPERRWSR